MSIRLREVKEVKLNNKEMKDFRDEHQGRSRRQVENNYKVMGWSIYGFIGFMVVYSIGKALAIW